MKINQIVKAVYEQMVTWAQEKGGRAVPASDEFEVYQVLLAGPKGFVVIVGYGGDDGFGDENENPLAKTAVEVTFGYNLGLDVSLGLKMFEAKGARPSLLELLDDCRARCASLVFPAEMEDSSRLLAYGGCAAVSLPNGFPLPAYKLRFTLDAAVEVDDARDVTIE